MAFKLSNIFKSNNNNGSSLKNRLTVSTMVGVTEVGKREISRNMSMGRDFDVLSPLDDRSPQTVNSLMRETGYSFDEIKPILERAEASKLVEYV